LLLALLLGTAWLTLWSLGSLPLTDVDEPVYGQVGREMARAGWAGWLTPHLGGQPWFDKPPLFYWLSALSMRAWGVSEWSARLPSALLAVALVAATYALARRCFPQERRAGLWAGFALATCVQFFLLARAAVTDMTLALTLTLALGALYVWTQTGRGQWVALAGAMTGLAALTKGPVALVLIGVQTVAYLLLTRQARRLLSAALWGGLGLCLLVSLPWYGAMIHLHGRLFIDGFLGANNVTRYLQAEHSATSSPLFFVPVLLGGFFPWSLLLPGALAAAWRQGRSEWAERSMDSPALFLLLWITLVFVFFSASQSKLITYIFPLYPAAAVLVGAWLASAVHTQEAKTATRAETFRMLVPLGLYVALSLALVILLFSVRAKYGIAPQTIIVWASVWAATIPFCLALGPRAWAIPGVAVAWLLLSAWCSPTWRTQETEVSDRRLAQAASLVVPPGGSLYALGLKHPSLRFYARCPVVYEDDHAQAAADLKAHPGAVYVLRPEVLDELREKYGVVNCRELLRFRRTVLIQATPARWGGGAAVPGHFTAPVRAREITEHL